MKQGKNTPLLCKEGPGEVGSELFRAKHGEK